MNHSCEPNCDVVLSNSRTIMIKAVRPIAEDEEVFFLFIIFFFFIFFIFFFYFFFFYFFFFFDSMLIFFFYQLTISYINDGADFEERKRKLFHSFLIAKFEKKGEEERRNRKLTLFFLFIGAFAPSAMKKEAKSRIKVKNDFFLILFVTFVVSVFLLMGYHN